MNVTLVKIGNSRGIRLPKHVIEQCGFERELEIEVQHRAFGHELVIRAATRPRDGWDGAFARMGECGDDELMDCAAEANLTWDEQEWDW